MINPPCDENDWLTLLADAPRWVPSASRMVLIAPHPDDESLGAGGLVASQRGLGVTVRVVAATDGEAAYKNAPNLAAVRRAEQVAALRELGVDQSAIVRLGFPDSGLENFVEEMTDRIRPLVDANTMLVAPWSGDPHRDHEACAKVAETLTRETGAQLVSYLFWAWHHRTAGAVANVRLCRLELSAEARLARARALCCHRSQLAWEGEEGPVLPPRLLLPAQRSFETFVIER